MKTKASLIAIICTAVIALHLGRANAQSASVAVTATADKPALSTGLDEIVKLTKAGIDDGVILVYVRGSSVAYTPTADDLIQLREAGVSTTVTAAVMQHGDDVRKSVAASYQAPAQPQQQPVTQPVQQQQPVVVAGPTYAQPASSVTVVGYPSSYGYSYPVGYSYAYPRYYGGYYSGGYYAGGCYPRYGAYYRSSGLSVGVSFGGYGGSHGGYYGGGYRGGYCGVRGGGGYRCR